MSVSINIENAVKKFGENTIIPDLTLHVREGELIRLSAISAWSFRTTPSSRI